MPNSHPEELSQDALIGDEQRKPSNLLIHPRYQIRQFLWFVFLGSSLTLVLCTLVYAYLFGVIDRMSQIYSFSPEAHASLIDEPLKIVLQLGGISLGVTVLFALCGIFITHRTAGPMYHLQRTMREIKKGKLDARVQLRPSDDFQEVSHEFNSLMDYLVKKGSRPKP